MLVYRALFPNGKSYIGITTGSLNTRVSQHNSDTNTRGSQLYVHKAIRKYGRDNILWSVLEDNIADQSTLKDREQFFILKYDTYKPKGYNLSLGGEGGYGYRHTASAKERIVKALIGRPCSVTTRKRIGLANSVKRPSKETRLKMSLAKKGRPVKPEVRELLLRYAHKYRMSEQHKKAVIAAHTGVPLTNTHRLKISLAKESDSSIYELTSPQGVTYEVSNLYVFCKDNSLRKHRIKDVCHGVRHCKSHKGWVGCVKQKVDVVKEAA